MIFMLFSSGPMLAANEIVLVPGSNQFKVIENTSSLLKISNTINSFNALAISTEKGVFVELTASLYSKSNAVGAPQLPVISKMIEIPEGMIPVVKVVSFEVKEYRLSDFGITQQLFPAQEPQSKSSIKKNPFEWNLKLYETNSFYGGELAAIETSGCMRGVQLASLVISPVEYNPVSNTIRVYNNLIVEIHFTGTKKASAESNKTKTHSVFFSNLFSNVLNYQAQNAVIAHASNIPVKYVIVSDPMFKNTLKPFIQWKIRRGFNVIEAYTDNPAVGTTTASIRSYLLNLYTTATADDPAPTFVLFVGDVDQIPSFNCGTHVSDLYYCEYTGDFLPEVFYGRFSANTVAELQPQIDKTLEYEQYRMPDPSYLNHVLMITGADATHQMTWGNGQINYGTGNYFNADHDLITHTYLQPEPAGANYSQRIKNDLNNGVCYANYTSHGETDGWADPSFSVADVAGLKNSGKYGLMVGNACYTNGFDRNSLGEALLRADHKGALGYIGASDQSYWDEDYWWGVGNGPIRSNPTYETTSLGAYDRIFHEHGEPLQEWYSTMGQMVFAGNLAVQESNSTLKKYYWEVYCLMGDPSTMIYFSEPAALTVDYNHMLPTGVTDFKVETEPYACVALSKNNILHGVAEADENGYANLALKPFTEAGFADIVITKQNRKPFIDSILVVSPNDSYLVLDTYQLKDFNGNKTQEPEPGKILTIDIALRNLGNTDAVNATSTLTTNDSYVALVQNKYTWQRIAGKGSDSATKVFTIKVSDNAPDLHRTQFTITTLAGSKSFTEKFTVLLYAPKLLTSIISFDDKTAGNGNGKIDPGESLFVSVSTSNTGHYKSAEGTTRLFATGDFVTVNSAAINFGAMEPGIINTSTFSFKVSPYAIAGSVVPIYVIAQAGSYSSVSGFRVPIGQQVEDFETGNSTSFNCQMKGVPWESCTSTRYEGRYSFRSGTINNSQQSEMYMHGQVLANDTISFYRKVSSENGYDFLKFYVDEVLLGSWSGNQDWEKESYPIAAGDHYFSWVYEKDEATGAGDDAAWIDYIEFPSISQKPNSPESVEVAADPPQICAGSPTQLYTFAPGETDEYTYKWSPDSTLSNPGIFNPVATPYESTTYYVQVNSATKSVLQEITVEVEPVPATPRISVSDGQLFSSASEGNQWYNSKGLIAGATAREFHPAQSESYYVKTMSTKGCTSAASDKVDFTFKLPSGENGFSAYPNPFTAELNFVYTLKSAGMVKILIYNSVGNEAGSMDEGIKSAGEHSATLDGSVLAAGIYYCKIFSNEGVQVVKAIKNR